MTHLFVLFCPVHQDLSGNLLISLFRVLWTHVNTKVFNKLPPPTGGHVQTLHRELQVDATGSYSDWTSTPFRVFSGQQKRPDAVKRWDIIDGCCLHSTFRDDLHPNATLLISPAGKRPLLSSIPVVEIMQRIHPRSCVILFSCSSRKKKWQIGNRELANRLWQRRFSEVRVTLAQRWVCGWEIQSGCKSGMQNNPTDGEWIIATLWSSQDFSLAAFEETWKSGVLLRMRERDDQGSVRGQHWLHRVICALACLCILMQKLEPQSHTSKNNEQKQPVSLMAKRS